MLRAGVAGLALFAFLAPALSASKSPAWRMSYATEGRDGSPEAYAQNRPEPPATKEIDNREIKRLVAFCQDRQTGFAVTTSGTWGYSFFGLSYRVTFRIDDGPEVAETWFGSPAINEALFPGDALAFLRTLPDEGSLFIRVTDAQGRDHDATFRLKGLAAARDAIARACEKN